MVKEKVNELLEKECLTYPPVIAQEVAMNVGLKVFTIGFSSLELPFNDISGFIDASTNTMYVNADEVPKRQNFTIAHELGHFILGHLQKDDYQMLFRKTKLERENYTIEKEANFFAANLLVPETFLKNVIKKYSFISNYELSNLFGVSETVIRRRKVETGIQ